MISKAAIAALFLATASTVHPVPVSIHAGRLIAVTGDPLQNVRLLEAPSAVTKGGKLIERDR